MYVLCLPRCIRKQIVCFDWVLLFAALKIWSQGDERFFFKFEYLETVSRFCTTGVGFLRDNHETYLKTNKQYPPFPLLLLQLLYIVRIRSASALFDRKYCVDNSNVYSVYSRRDLFTQILNVSLREWMWAKDRTKGVDCVYDFKDKSVFFYVP